MFNSFLNYGTPNICFLCYNLLVLVIKMSYVPSDQQQDSRHWDQEVRSQQEIVAFEQEVREQQQNDREAHQDQREAQQDTREQQQDKRYKKIERYIT